MSRRSPPQPKIDDQAFPVRIFIVVPEGGLRGRLDAAYRWLDKHVGRSDYALHGGGRGPVANGLADRVALYLRSPGAGAEFIAAFPDLELADGTQAVTYSSPSRRPA